MPTILHEDAETGRFRIIPDKPLYYFSDWNRCWYRVLMMEQGYYLRMRLTPIDPTVESQWLEVLNEEIQWGMSSWSVFTPKKDRYTQNLPSEVVRHMHYHLGSPHAERLLTGDIWSEIAPLWPVGYTSPHDVTDWLCRCGYNGGIVLSRVQKNPGTWTEIREAENKRRNEEREAKVSAVLGDLAPLTEAEKELGLSLEGHDWSYDYSDDIDVYRRGREHRNELTLALKSLPVERARAIWAAFAPSHAAQYWKCPV